MSRCSRLRHVGQIGDYQVDRRWYCFQKITVMDKNPVFKPLTADVRASERDGTPAGVCRPYFDIGARDRYRYRDRSDPRPDIGDAGASPVKSLASLGNHPLACLAWSHDPSRCAEQRQTVEEHSAHTPSVSRLLSLITSNPWRDRPRVSWNRSHECPNESAEAQRAAQPDTRASQSVPRPVSGPLSHRGLRWVSSS